MAQAAHQIEEWTTLITQCDLNGHYIHNCRPFTKTQDLEIVFLVPLPDAIAANRLLLAQQRSP
jgi:hypothetical protein